MVETSAGTILRHKNREIPVRRVTTFGSQGWGKPLWSWEETLYRSPEGTLFLLRDAWRGRYGDGHRPRRHAYKVRRIGRIGALLWMLNSIDTRPEHLRVEQAKLARQFWASLGKGGAF